MQNSKLHTTQDYCVWTPEKIIERSISTELRASVRHIQFEREIPLLHSLSQAFGGKRREKKHARRPLLRHRSVSVSPSNPGTQLAMK